MKQTLGEQQVVDKLGEEDVAAIKEHVENTIDWLDNHPTEDAETYESKTKALQEVISPYMSKIYGQQGPEGGMEPGTDAGPEPGAGASSTEASVEEVD